MGTSTSFYRLEMYDSANTEYVLRDGRLADTPLDFQAGVDTFPNNDIMSLSFSCRLWVDDCMLFLYDGNNIQGNELQF